MGLVVITGKQRSYLLSSIKLNAPKLPNWAGIFIAIKAFDENGLRVDKVVLIGMANNLQEYQDRIQRRCRHFDATHLYLLPEYKDDVRMESLMDIMSQEPYNHPLDLDDSLPLNFRERFSPQDAVGATQHG